jgi:hypothetical protein
MNGQYRDSKLVVGWMNRQYRNRNFLIQDAMRRARELKENFNQIVITHIYI